MENSRCNHNVAVSEDKILRGSKMKKITFVGMFCFCFWSVVSGQITLQKVNSKTTVLILKESRIRLKYPTITSNDSCDCYHSYYGFLKSRDNNNLKMLVTSEEQLFVDENGVGKKSNTSYSYKNQKIENTLLTDNLISLSKTREGNRNIQQVGAVLAMLSIVHSFTIAPFFDGEIRRKSDKIALGAFVLGVSTAFLRTEKTYHFQQPKNKKKKALWQIKL